MFIASKSRFWRIRRKLSRALAPSDNSFAEADDYNWSLYTGEYRGEIRSVGKVNTLLFQKGDLIFADQRLVPVADDIRPHPNHLLLYETLVLLSPGRILEAGCGAGDHLANLSTLLPDAVLVGVDRSPEQLDFLRERHPNPRFSTSVADLSLPLPYQTQTVDVAFTQAVIMHMQTGNSHRVALANLFRIAEGQVLLMENWQRHNFVSDIKQLHELGIIGWRDLYLYRREIATQQGQAKLLVASSIELPFEVLHSDEDLMI